METKKEFKRLTEDEVDAVFFKYDPIELEIAFSHINIYNIIKDIQNALEEKQ